MVRAGVWFCCVLALLAGWSTHAFTEPGTPAADPVGPRVRSATPEVERLIAQGIKRSSSFANLVTALNKSKVIVYVQATRDLPAGVDGQLALTTSRTRQRYLRAQVLAGLGPEDTIAIIAHELQHALEVAAHEEVRDRKELAALYKRIGVDMRGGRFDTVAAQAMGKRVRGELG